MVSVRCLSKRLVEGGSRKWKADLPRMTCLLRRPSSAYGIALLISLRRKKKFSLFPLNLMRNLGTKGRRIWGSFRSPLPPLNPHGTHHADCPWRTCRTYLTGTTRSLSSKAWMARRLVVRRRVARRRVGRRSIAGGHPLA